MKKNAYRYVASKGTNNETSNSTGALSPPKSKASPKPAEKSNEKQKQNKQNNNNNNNNNTHERSASKTPKNVQSKEPPKEVKSGPTHVDDRPKNRDKRDVSDDSDSEEEEPRAPLPEERQPAGFCFQKLLNYKPFVESKEIQEALEGRPYGIKSTIGKSSSAHPHPISAALRTCVTAWALADIMKHYKGIANVRVASVYSSSRDQTIVDYANQHVVDSIRLEHVRPVLVPKDLSRDVNGCLLWEGAPCLAAFSVDAYRVGNMHTHENNGPLTQARMCDMMEQLGLLEDFPPQEMSRPFYWIGHRFTGDAGIYEKEGAWHRVKADEAQKLVGEMDVIYSKPDDTGAAYGPDPACDWIWEEKPWKFTGTKSGYLTWTVLKSIGSFSIVKFQVLNRQLFSPPVAQYTPEFTRIDIKVEEDYFGADFVRSCDPGFGWAYTPDTFLLPTALKVKLFTRPSMSVPSVWGLRVLEQSIGNDLNSDPAILLHAKLFPDLWVNKLALLTSWKTQKSNQSNSRLLPVLGLLTQRVLPKIKAFFTVYGQTAPNPSYWKRKLACIFFILMFLYWMAKKFSFFTFLRAVMPATAHRKILCPYVPLPVLEGVEDVEYNYTFVEPRENSRWLPEEIEDLHLREENAVQRSFYGIGRPFQTTNQAESTLTRRRRQTAWFERELGWLPQPEEEWLEEDPPPEFNRGQERVLRRYNLWPLPPNELPDPPPPARPPRTKMGQLMVRLWELKCPDWLRRDVRKRLPYLMHKYGMVCHPDVWKGGFTTFHLLYGSLLAPVYEEMFKAFHPLCALYLPLMEFAARWQTDAGWAAWPPLVIHALAYYCTCTLGLPFGIWIHLCWNIAVDHTAYYDVPIPTVQSHPFIEVGWAPPEAPHPEGLAANAWHHFYRLVLWLWRRWFPIGHEWDAFVNTYHKNPLWSEKKVVHTDRSFAEDFAPEAAKVENQKVPFTVTVKRPDEDLTVRMYDWVTNFHKEEYASTWFLMPLDVFSCSIAKTPHAMLFMVQTRILVPAPGNQFKAQILWQKLEYYIPALFPLLPVMCHEELTAPWIARFTGSKRAKYLEALRRFNDEGMVSVTLGMDYTELMLKTDELLIRINGDQYELKPRCIAKVSEYVQVYTGPCVDKAQHDLAAFWNCHGHLVCRKKGRPHYGITIAFACGWTPVELNTWMNMAIAQDDLSHILVSGDDSVVYDHRRQLWMEGDLGMCDQSQGFGPLRFQRHAFYRLGVPDDVAGIVEDLTRVRYMVKHPDTMGRIIIQRSLRPMRDTGGVDTCIGNSIYTAVLLFAHLHLGWDFLDLGADMKMRFHPTWKGVSFLKGLWYPTAAGPYWGPLPSRFLKVGKSRRHPGELYPHMCYEDASLQFLIDLAWGYSAAYPVPLLRRFVAQFQPLKGKIRDCFAEDWQTVLFSPAEGPFPEMSEEVWKILFERYSLTREDFERAEALIPPRCFVFLSDPVFLAMAMKDYC
jgi:hypothetical protein